MARFLCGRLVQYDKNRTIYTKKVLGEVLVSFDIDHRHEYAPNIYTPSQIGPKTQPQFHLLTNLKYVIYLEKLLTLKINSHGKQKKEPFSD